MQIISNLKSDFKVIGNKNIIIVVNLNPVLIFNFFLNKVLLISKFQCFDIASNSE